MDRVYYIYEWYDHCYSGFADYKGALVHFEYKSFISSSTDKAPPIHLYEIISATTDFLNKEISGELYFINWCEQKLPEILDLSTFAYEREKHMLKEIISDYPNITDEQWKAAETQFQNYLFRDDYLEQNKNLSFCKKATIHFNGKPNTLPYENIYIKWLE